MKKLIALPDNEIHLWLCEPETIRDSLLLQHYQNLMTDQEHARQQRYRFDKDKHSALITRALVRTVLSRYADRPAGDWRFEKGEKDKPEIIDPPFNLRFNLSHTDGLIICALAREYDLGADVENVTRNSDVLNIADRFFSATEVEELFSHPSDDDKRSRFFDYWTLKESYIKAWGLGLAIPLGDFSFHIGERGELYETDRMNHDIRLSFAPKREDNPSDWQSWLLYPSDTHRMAVSIRSGQDIDYKLRLFKTVPLLSEREIRLTDTSL